jgi:hypothetical protein
MYFPYGTGEDRADLYIWDSDILRPVLFNWNQSTEVMVFFYVFFLLFSPCNYILLSLRGSKDLNLSCQLVYFLLIQATINLLMVCMILLIDQ